MLRDNGAFSRRHTLRSVDECCSAGHAVKLTTDECFSLLAVLGVPLAIALSHDGSLTGQTGQYQALNKHSTWNAGYSPTAGRSAAAVAGAAVARAMFLLTF